MDVEDPIESNYDMSSSLSRPIQNITASKQIVEGKITDNQVVQLSRGAKSLSSLGVGTFSIDHEAVSRGLSSGILNKRGKMQRCGNCKGCNASNCEKCVNCRNMVKYGGPGNLKQACVERRCIRPQTPMQDGIQDNCVVVKGPEGLETFTMSNISTILPTTTAEMIKMDEVSTKYIKEAINVNTNVQPMDQSEIVARNPNNMSINIGGVANFNTPIKNTSSVDVTINDSEHASSPSKGFFKMLRRAERYVAELDPYDTSRPKLSYGAMCAMAIQVIGKVYDA